MNFRFAFVILLSHALGQDRAVDPADDWLSLFACILAVASIAALGRWISLAASIRIEADFPQRAAILKRYYRWTRFHDAYSLLAYATLLHWCGWTPLVADRWGWRGWFAVDRILLLAPYLAGDLLSAASFYQFDYLLRRKLSGIGVSVQCRERLGEFLGVHFRTQFGFLLFACLFVALMDDIGKRAAPQALEHYAIATAYWWAITLLLILSTPFVIRYVLQAKPLIRGPLREQLDRLAAQLRLRYADILVWNTDGMMANALMIGIVPRWRYVMISDVIIDQFSPEELQAVFGHEIGHIRHRHIYSYLFFILLSVLLMTLLSQRLEPVLLAATPEPWQAIVQQAWSYVPLEVVLLAPFVGLGFGWWSRRCERQADVFSCRAVSRVLLDRPPPILALGPPAGDRPTAVTDNPRQTESLAVLPEGAWLVIHALKKTAALNRLPETRWLWLHGSIASRVDFLERVSRDPPLADRYDRHVRRLRWLISIGLVAGNATLWLWK